LFNSSDIFLLLKTKEVTGNDTTTIAAYVFYNLIYAIASYPMGILADKFSFKKIIMLGFVLFAIVYGGFALNPSTVVIFILFFIYGIYAATTEGIIKAWITNLAQGENTATAIGFYTSCESTCSLLASIIAGTLWTFCGSPFVFLSSSIIAVFVFIYFLFRMRSV
jgi:MFS family permease